MLNLTIMFIRYFVFICTELNIVSTSNVIYLARQRFIAKIAICLDYKHIIYEIV